MGVGDVQEDRFWVDHPAMARRILAAAIAEDRDGELLDCLQNGGAATVDSSGHLVLATAKQLRGLAGGGD